MAKDDSILPIAGKYLTNTLKQQYVDAISQIISDMGREVTIHLHPVESGCPNCDYLSVGGRSRNVYDASNPFALGPYNKPFPDNMTCPVCRGTHIIKFPKSYVWHATIVKRPEEYDYSAGTVSPENVVLTKMRIEAWDDVKNAIRVTIDGLDYVRLTDPYKRGMGNQDSDLKFVETYWQRVT
jgi:hypothetical protein